VLLFWGESTATSPIRCFRREIIHLEHQKHTFAGFGLCFAQIAETARTPDTPPGTKLTCPRTDIHPGKGIWSMGALACCSARRRDDPKTAR
jgi:hypothetical protein